MSPDFHSGRFCRHARQSNPLSETLEARSPHRANQTESVFEGRKLWSYRDASRSLARCDWESKGVLAISAIEPRTALGQSIDVWTLNHRVPITPKVIVHIIHSDEEDIHPLCGRNSGGIHSPRENQSERTSDEGFRGTSRNVKRQQSGWFFTAHREERLRKQTGEVDLEVFVGLVRWEPVPFVSITYRKPPRECPLTPLPNCYARSQPFNSD